VAAIDTLHPNSIPDTSNPKSKLETLATVIGSLADADHDVWKHLADLTVSPDAGRGGPDSAGRNRGSIAGHVNAAAKTAVKEMLNSTGTDLSEEFKEATASIFETALNARANLEAIVLQEGIRVIYEELQEKLDEHLNALNEHFEGEDVNEGARPSSDAKLSPIMEQYVAVLSRTRPR
jgi:hypothetical protein